MHHHALAHKLTKVTSQKKQRHATNQTAMQIRNHKRNAQNLPRHNPRITHALISLLASL